MEPYDAQPKAERRDEEQHGNGMVGMAEQVERHHLAPMPGAEVPEYQVFPPVVMRGLGLGALLGAILGLIFGILLLDGTLVVPGFEGLYSMASITFYVFWTMVGVAVGVITLGIGAILVAPTESGNSRTTSEQQKGG